MLKKINNYFAEDLEVPDLDLHIIDFGSSEVNHNLEDIDFSIWVDKTKTKHKIKNMSNKHIQNCIKFLEKSNFNEEIIQGYLESFEKELKHRKENNINIIKRNGSLLSDKAGRKLTKAFKKLSEEDWDNLPSKVNMKCACGNEYQTRKADLKRGWGLSCSKSCSAKRKLNLQQPAKII